MKVKQAETRQAAKDEVRGDVEQHAPEILAHEKTVRADLLPVHFKMQSAPATRSKKRKPWSTELHRQLPESELLRVHHELLHKRDREVIVVGQGIAREVRIIDHGVNVKAAEAALRLGYKLHGRLNDEVQSGAPSLNVYNLFLKPQVQERLRGYEFALKAEMKREAKAINADTKSI